MFTRIGRLIGVFAICALLGWMVGQTVQAAAAITVDDLGDDGDLSPGDGLCATSGGGCTLRAAIEELNAVGAGTMPHHIRFAITGTGPFTITPASPLPPIDVPLIIDGTTQTGVSCPAGQQPANLLIVLDGSNAGFREDGLVFDNGSDGSTIQGLVIGNFEEDGIRLNSDGNKVRCNHIGVGADGVSPMGNGVTGIFLAGEGNVVGGPNAHAARNVISDNGRPLQIYGAANTVVNNFIGTSADGMSALGNDSGIIIALPDNTIGGPDPLDRNIISGSGGYAIYVSQADNNVIQGNLIGLARDGMTPIPNGGNGITVFGHATDNLIGGIEAGAGNKIAYNEGDGISVSANGSLLPERNAIRGNDIFENEDLGIAMDDDSNNGQDYPQLVEATAEMKILGMLTGAPNTMYDLDLFRSATCDASGYGEGQQFLGTFGVTADGVGQVAIDLDLVGLVTYGDVITATATDPDGNSSAFSNCVVIPYPTQLFLPVMVNP